VFGSVVFEKESHYLALAAFKLTGLLPLPPDCWDYRYVPPCLAKYPIFKHREVAYSVLAACVDLKNGFLGH
jgi:hypothetical protein